MSFNYYISPAFDQDRTWNVDLPELVAAIRARWPDAEIVEPDALSEYLDFTVTQGDHRLDFHYDPNDRTLVFPDQEPPQAVAEVVSWFLNTVGPDVPAVGFDELEPAAVPIPPNPTPEQIARDFFGAQQ